MKTQECALTKVALGETTLDEAVSNSVVISFKEDLWVSLKIEEQQ